MSNINILTDYCRALTTELKDTRRQVFSGLGSHNPPDERAASEADQVQLLLVELYSHIDATLDAFDKFVVEIRVNKLFDDA